MPDDNIAEYLRFIPRSRLECDLLDLEDEVLRRLPGNIYALETCFRYLIRAVLRHGRLPGSLPMRLTRMMGGRPGGLRRGTVVSSGEFRIIRRRVTESLRGLATARMALQPITDVKYEDDPEAERRRRAVIYARQIADLDTMYARWHVGRGPYAKAIWCLSTGKQFPSARKAAEWASEATGRTIRRSDIRTAIKRGCRCGGFQWGYDQGAVPELRPSGRGVAVRCVEFDRPFLSRAQAAAFAGVSVRSLKLALARDGEVKPGRNGPALRTLTFVYAEAPDAIAEASPNRQMGLFDGLIAAS